MQPLRATALAVRMKGKRWDAVCARIDLGEQSYARTAGMSVMNARTGLWPDHHMYARSGETGETLSGEPTYADQGGLIGFDTRAWHWENRSRISR